MLRTGLITSLVFILSMAVNGQNTITAGQTSGKNIRYTDLVPDSLINMGFGNIYYQYLVLDIDDDHNSDVKFSIKTVFMGGNDIRMTTSIVILNNDLKLITTEEHADRAHNLETRESVSSSLNWSETDSLLMQLYIHESYIMPPFDTVIGECDYGYIGFKLNAPDETLFGWIHFEGLQTTFGLQVTDFALCGVSAVTDPFASDGALWHYTLGTVNPEFSVFKTISAVSDTAINGIMCSKLLEQDYEQTPASKVYHYMYKQNDSVFFFKDGGFHLLYDFGAEAGDTIVLGYYTTHSGAPLKMIIDSTGSIMVNGQERKIQHITCGDGIIIEFGNHVIEGIGNTSLMFPTLDLSYDGPLRCYQDNSMDTFFNPLYAGPAWDGEDCEEVINSLEEQPVTQVSLYPNPAQDLFTIKGLSEVITYRLYTCEGIPVKEGSVNSSEVISINDLHPGIYLCEIIAKKSTFVRKLIVK